MLDPKRGYVGKRIGGEAKTERGHFYTCNVCGQDVDKRDLRAVMHHDERGHLPLPSPEGKRVLRVSGMLRFTLDNRRP